MTLPILLSVPHAGLMVPEPLRPLCALTEAQVAKDGDEGAREIYALRDEVLAFVTTDVARAVIDMNRAPDDRRKDGIVKTHTCWDETIWRRDLTEDEVAFLMDTVHRPYHDALRSEAAREGVVLCVDGHTMAAEGPPIGPDPGVRRPDVCLGDGGGSCPPEWMAILAESFAAHFDEVRINDPFGGGYITRHHGKVRPWVQVELARTVRTPYPEQRERVFAALAEAAARIAPA